MRKNTYKLDNIDCALCATKIEEGISKLTGIVSCNLNYITLNFIITFDESIISDEEIEKNIHKSLKGVKIIKKNNKEFIDTYEEQKIFKKILYKGKK